MNAILNRIYESGVICPTDIEVEDLQDLKSFLDGFYDTWIREYKIQTLTSFINLVTVYVLNEEFEEEVNEFDMKKYLRELHM